VSINFDRIFAQNCAVNIYPKHFGRNRRSQNRFLFSFLLLFPYPVVSRDQHVHAQRAIEGATDAEVEHAAAEDDQGAFEPVLVQKVLDQN
jgi:hypothetical protein